MSQRIAARRVVTTQGVIGPAAVVVDGGVVVSIDACGSADAADVTLAPGFVDLQVNGIDDVDVWHAALHDPAGFERLDALLVAQGVTTWLPTLVTAPLDRYARALDTITAVAQRPGARPSVAGVHLEGPFLGRAIGAHPAAHVRALDADALDWLDRLPRIVRLVTLGPELDCAAAVISNLTTCGVRVAIGHTTADPDEIDAAILAGATLATHLGNAMGPLHHRTVGTLGAVLGDDRLVATVIGDGVHVHPDVLRIALRQKGPERLALVTDAVAWRHGRAGTIALALRDGAPRLPDGTLAGSALTMDAALRRMVDVGASMRDAVTMASTTPARLLGLDDRGVIATGRRADLVALDPNLAVSAVWIAGEHVS
jgi:N-acetylglucosamine-6-phosphate deacetylase